jgi:hypothetical protein
MCQAQGTTFVALSRHPRPKKHSSSREVPAIRGNKTKADPSGAPHPASLQAVTTAKHAMDGFVVSNLLRMAWHLLRIVMRLGKLNLPLLVFLDGVTRRKLG